MIFSIGRLPRFQALTHFERNVMNFIIWLIVGGLIGWLASMLMKTNHQQGIFLNVVVGIVGAMLGGGSSRPWSASARSTRTISVCRHCSSRSSAPPSCWPS